LPHHLAATNRRFRLQPVMSRQQRPRPGQNTLAFRGKPLKPLPALNQNRLSSSSRLRMRIESVG
jgi:hypothetical protein